jgi:hypothetical protein
MPFLRMWSPPVRSSPPALEILLKCSHAYKDPVYVAEIQQAAAHIEDNIAQVIETCSNLCKQQNLDSLMDASQYMLDLTATLAAFFTAIPVSAEALLSEGCLQLSKALAHVHDVFLPMMEDCARLMPESQQRSRILAHIAPIAVASACAVGLIAVYGILENGSTLASTSSSARSDDPESVGERILHFLMELQVRLLEAAVAFSMQACTYG